MIKKTYLSKDDFIYKFNEIRKASRLQAIKFIFNERRTKVRKIHDNGLVKCNNLVSTFSDTPVRLFNFCTKGNPYL